MEIKIGASCWSQITAELDRTYPLEGVLVPLVGLIPGRRDRDPCATLQLCDIRCAVIARAVLVPRALQVNQAARVGVRARTDWVINQEVERLTRQHPRLRACAYLHSHPFARGSTWPSSGCLGDHEGHMLPLLRRNRAAALDTSFSFIACLGSQPPGWSRGAQPWRLQGFALGQDEQVMDLGFAAVVPDDDPDLRHLLRPSRLGRSPYKQVTRRWRRELRRAGIRFHGDELFDGWQRWIITPGPHLSLVILLPMDFPDRPPRYHAVFHHSGEVIALKPRRPLSVAPDAWLRLVRQIQQEETYELAG